MNKILSGLIFLSSFSAFSQINTTSRTFMYAQVKSGLNQDIAICKAYKKYSDSKLDTVDCYIGRYNENVFEIISSSRDDIKFRQKLLYSHEVKELESLLLNKLGRGKLVLTVGKNIDKDSERDLSNSFIHIRDNGTRAPLTRVRFEKAL